MLSVDGNLVARDKAIFVGDDAVVWTIFFFTSIFGDGHHQIRGLRAGNREVIGNSGDYILDLLVSVGIVPLISQLASAVRPHREARLNGLDIVRRDDTIKVLRLTDDIRLAVRLAAANGAVAVGVVTVHVGRDLARGIADLIHFVTAVHAAIDVDVFFCRGFGIALQKITRAVIRALKGDLAATADFPVAVLVGLPDTLVLVAARLTFTILAKVIGVLAFSMLAVLGTGLAQAAGFAEFLLAGAFAAGRAGVGIPFAGVIRADVVLFAVFVAVRAQLAGLAKVVRVEAVGAVRAHMLVIVVGILLTAVVLAVGTFGAAGAAPAELAGVVAGALVAVGAEVVLIVAALDAQIVVAALGLGVFAAAFLAQAAVVAYLKTRAVPAAIALLAAGQFGAA